MYGSNACSDVSKSLDNSAIHTRFLCSGSLIVALRGKLHAGVALKNMNLRLLLQKLNVMYPSAMVEKTL